MNDRGNRYYQMKTEELKRLKGLKENRIRAIGRKEMGYYDVKERDILVSQLGRIDAVLKSRRYQLALPE